MKQLNTTNELSLRGRVNEYKRKIRKIEEYLSKYPYEWGKFQTEFNFEINAVFRELMEFEQRCTTAKDEEKLYKLKRVFVNKIRKPFERGEYIKWVIKKPYGYAGDFKYIEDIYENNPQTTGFDRLFDNYTMMSSIAIAVRNRKNDFKKMMIEFCKKRQGQTLRVMDLASGPCREIYELFVEEKDLSKNLIFDCYDSDPNSIEFSKKRLHGHKNVNFFLENAARIAFRKDINALINQKYDIIYSTGLFDYFEERIAFRLIENLRKLLNPNGVLMISDVRDKYSNPSLHFMEWVGDWELVYRNDEDFRDLFYRAGFKEKDLNLGYEQQGILQYICAYLK